MPLYVKVVDESCCGYTVCADICPEIYKLDDQGFAYVEDQAVPEGLDEKARKGAESCPEKAILTSEDPFD